jgi:peptidoglycan/LPS O-acetylase OafA/YrhL
MKQPPPAPIRLDFLDGIRGLAALYVLLHHIWLTSFPLSAKYGATCHICLDAPVWSTWLRWGHLSVVVFIVVSGFSLALAPMRNADRLPGGFRRYIYRRAWRILPPYWAALALSCLLIVASTGQYTGRTVDAKAVVVHALLVNNVIDSAKPNPPFWSIAVEWQIYFVFPILLLAVRKYGSLVMACGTVALTILAYILGLRHEALANLLDLDPHFTAPLGKLLHLTPQFLALFELGVLFAHVFIKSGWIYRVPWMRIGTLLGGSTLAALVVLDTRAVEQSFFWIDLLVGTTTATLFAGFAQHPQSLPVRILGSTLPAWLGQSSYSLYLIHAPVLELLYHSLVLPHISGHNEQFFLLLVLALPVAILASRGFWRCFEQPFLRQAVPHARRTARRTIRSAMY